MKSKRFLCKLSKNDKFKLTYFMEGKLDLPSTSGFFIIYQIEVKLHKRKTFILTFDFS